MNVFVINLDKDSARLFSVKKQLHSLGVEFIRIPGVYARDMPIEEKRKHVSSFRWWCAIGRKIRDGEMGCALSHRNILQSVAQSNAPACILEDDVVLDNRFKQILRYAEEHLDLYRPQVLLLSNHRYDTGLGKWHSGYLSAVSQQCECHRSDWDFYTEGYVISPLAAHALLTANYPLITPCDHWGRWAKMGIIELFHVFPTVCSQNKDEYESATTNDDDKTLVKYWPFYRKWPHKFCRAVGKTIDMILWKVTGR